MNIISDYANSKNVEVKCRLVGSMAKKTSLIDKADIDIFITFPLDYPESDLKKYGLEFGKYCIDQMNGESEIRYASHPYITGLINGYEVDFVPCYNIKNASQLKSAVDRTILHTDYVQAHLTADEANQVLLLKKFMTCVNTYGANSKVNGFSGYLCELLILKYHTFENLVNVAANKWHNRYKIDLEKYGTANNFKDPLIVIDPVDKNRNVAAALTMQKYSEFIIACRNFLNNPSIDYFKDREINTNINEIITEFDKRATKTYILSFNIPELPDDVIYPQINKTMNSFVSVSEIYDFNIIENNFYIHNNKAYIILEYEIDRLSNVKIHHGPQVKYKDNGENFKNKYPNAYIKDNNWISISERKYKTVTEMIENIVKVENRSILKLGKNIKDEITDNYSLEILSEFLKQEDTKKLEEMYLHIYPDYRLTR